VRLTLTRAGVYRITGGRTLTEQRVAIGAGDDGRFSAIIHTGLSALTANALAEPFTFPARHLYAARSLKIEQRIADVPMVANTFTRAPGEAVGSFALESASESWESLGRSPTRSTTRPAVACATCRSRSTSCSDPRTARRRTRPGFPWSRSRVGTRQLAARRRPASGDRGAGTRGNAHRLSWRIV
jgi:xanthine dehydrogenase YagR molybdenum-binding subunit